MSKEQNITNVNESVGFTGFLTLLLVAFKLLGIINWPWIWVLAPLWISAGLILALVALVCVGLFAYVLYRAVRD